MTRRSLQGNKRAKVGGYLERRLFAVRAPGPAVDISVQVFWIGGKVLKLDPESESPGKGFVDLQSTSNQMIAAFTTNDRANPEFNVNLTWDQVAELLRK